MSTCVCLTFMCWARFLHAVPFIAIKSVLRWCGLVPPSPPIMLDNHRLNWVLLRPLFWVIAYSTWAEYLLCHTCTYQNVLTIISHYVNHRTTVKISTDTLHNLSSSHCYNIIIILNCEFKGSRLDH